MQSFGKVGVLALRARWRGGDPIGPNEYASSVPAARKGERSTKGIKEIHSGGNRHDRRVGKASERRTYTEPAYLGGKTFYGARSKSKRASRKRFEKTLETQNAVMTAHRRGRIKHGRGK